MARQPNLGVMIDEHLKKAGEQSPNTGAVLWAAWRQGLKDLQNNLIPAFPNQQLPGVSEPGSIANPTQLEVYQDKHHQTPYGEYGIHGRNEMAKPGQPEQRTEAKADQAMERQPQQQEQLGPDPLQAAKEAASVSQERETDKQMEQEPER
ncbi:hypothetical protein [Tautonia rosea]|uniref:hypothetical protein n=1 Tax=Tautonia rosea TaxID=2728037 RepID=UPI001476032E|nr:hypothetical protein [Tautonia rosea]